MRLVLRWLDSPWAFELTPGLNKLGRNPTNDFRISDPSVSSFHAEISVDRDFIRVRDLGSTNGTFIDGQRIDEGTLRHENELRLGTVRLRLEEVLVTPAQQVPTPQPQIAPFELAPTCAYHASVRAAYRCENCGGAFCGDCVTVMGQDRFGPTTICPVCKGQCNPLTNKPEEKGRSTLLERFTKTLKIPFAR
jgi:pSer/pThr/pTyr-binding forkhead associated (FHA) protein